MQAAVLALRRLRPARIVVAVMAAPSSTCDQLRLEVDEVVYAAAPSPFFAVGQSCWDFTQPTDEEVRDLLRAAARAPGGAAGNGGPPSAVTVLWLTMRYSTVILRLLRPSGVELVPRIAGLLLSAIAVQLAADAIRAFIKQG